MELQAGVNTLKVNETINHKVYDYVFVQMTEDKFEAMFGSRIQLVEEDEFSKTLTRQRDNQLHKTSKEKFLISNSNSKVSNNMLD